MPNPNAVVSSVSRVERDSIELGNQRRVRLDPERPDTRGLGNALIDSTRPQRADGPVRRRQRVGGLLSYYYRTAA